MLIKVKQLIFGAGLLLLSSTAWATNQDCAPYLSPPTTLDNQFLEFFEPHLKTILLNLITDATYIKMPDGETHITWQSDIGRFKKPPLRFQLHAPEEVQHMWRSEIWSYNNRKYVFLDFGPKNLETEYRAKLRALLIFMRKHPLEDVIIDPDPLRLEDMQFIREARGSLSESVLKIYERTKPYLESRDISSLRKIDTLADSNDILALFEASPETEHFDKESLPMLKDNLAMTGQLSYFGLQNFEGINSLNLADLLVPEIADAFPTPFLFQYRFDSELQMKVHKTLRTQFNVREIAEITRFAKPAKHLPDAVRDKMILELFRKHASRQKKVFIASLDHHTYELFSHRYGFKKLMDLTLAPSAHPEYIAYLDVRSPEYQALYHKLSQSASAIQTITNYRKNW